MRLRLALAAVLLVAGAACSGDGDDADPSPTTGATTSTTVPDRSGVALTGVPGETTSTIVERGSAVITGSVQGPAGLVVGATVRVERLVAGREIRTDVLTGPDGRFRLQDLPGGRYRVRAFLAPTLAQVEPDVRFLEDGGEHDFALVMEEHAGLLVRADVAPEPPLLDRPVNLVVVISSRTVDPEGIVRSQPVAGVSVELTGLGRWTLREPDEVTTSTTDDLFGPTFTTTPTQSPSARTSSTGLVRYELRCERTGSPNLALRVPVRRTPPVGTDPTVTTIEPSTSVEVFSLDLPACVDPATTTTVPPSTVPTPTTRP